MTQESFEKLKAASCPEEIEAIFKTSNQPLSPEQAQKIYTALQSENELSLEDLKSVVGGLNEVRIVPGNIRRYDRHK